MKTALAMAFLLAVAPAAAGQVAPKPELSIRQQIQADRAKATVEDQGAPTQRPWDRNANGKRPWDRIEPPSK